MIDPVAVEFYFDIVSPYSYFGFERLCRYEKAWNLAIDLRPVHLGTILRTSGIKDIKRCAQELQLDFNLDLSSPPTSSFADMCTIAALKTIIPPNGFKIIVAKLFSERVAHSAPPSDTFACLAPSYISEEVLAQAKTISQNEEFKHSFEIQQSDLVNNYGAFGLPWIVLQRPGETQKECFWGWGQNANTLGLLPTLNKGMSVLPIAAAHNYKMGEVEISYIKVLPLHTRYWRQGNVLPSDFFKKLIQFQSHLHERAT
ncbi:thioredoxin-like protein [Ceratobasidium sp. AG-I]|nr:thioredoxin-like protein [Ceratobasidium sp. AG-I]